VTQSLRHRCQLYLWPQAKNKSVLMKSVLLKDDEETGHHRGAEHAGLKTRRI
jgi:hypothetical protein